MKKEIITALKNEMDLLRLRKDFKMDDLSSRQIDLLYGKKYSYVRHYITWLLQNETPLFCVANFIRFNDNLVDMCPNYFICLSNSRFRHKLFVDFLVELTFDEFRWLCANNIYFV